MPIAHHLGARRRKGRSASFSVSDLPFFFLGGGGEMIGTAISSVVEEGLAQMGDAAFPLIVAATSGVVLAGMGILVARRKGSEE